MVHTRLVIDTDMLSAVIKLYLIQEANSNQSYSTATAMFGSLN